MAYLRVFDHSLGRPVKFVSRKARDRQIKDMLRKQARLLTGVTVRDTSMPMPYDGKPRRYSMKKNIDYRALEKQADNLALLVKEYKE